MSELNRTPSDSPAPDVVHRLESWKEIAGYLRRSVRTVQRWEAKAGLPVRRLPDLGTVYAHAFELDAWWERDRTRLEPEKPPLPDPVRVPPSIAARVRRMSPVVVAAAVLISVALGTRGSNSDAARPVEPGVREAYLKGRLFLETPTVERTRKAIDSFEAAVRGDPGHAAAYAGLARAHLASANLLVPTRATIAPARAAARKAISLDPASAEAYTSRGLLRAALDWDLPGAERDLRRAVAIDHADGRAHLYLGITLVLQGRAAEGVAVLEKAREVDPLSVKINARLGMIYALLGRTEPALAQCRKATDLDAYSAEGEMCLGYVLERTGSYRSAAKAYQRAGDLGYRSAAHVARALALAGQATEARRRLRVLAEERQKGRAWSPYELAKVSNALGDEAATYAWLETAYADHDDTLIALSVDPEWTALRSDTRFLALVRRVAHAPRQGLD
jgi:tetratricopeptide (TPR) repeat protein